MWTHGDERTTALIFTPQKGVQPQLEYFKLETVALPIALHGPVCPLADDPSLILTILGIVVTVIMFTISGYIASRIHR